jgi:hypothetical protein
MGDGMEPPVISSPTILQQAGRIAFLQQRVSDMPSAEPCVGGEVIPESTLAARLALEEAVRLDPRSLRAWSQLATCYISDYKNRWNGAGKEEVGLSGGRGMPSQGRMRST